MDEGSVVLLDTTGTWTHRDRHQHHHFDIEVPERTIDLWIRFRWGPLDMGSEHEANGLSLSLFGPDGYRGGAMRSREDQEISIGPSAASLGFVAGPIESGRWTINVDSGEILPNGIDTGYLTYRIEANARIGDSPESGSPATAPATATGIPAVRPLPADGPRWYRGDLHSHTVHSDGAITVVDRVRGAVERGLDFLAITDHNTISHHREVNAWPDTITPIRGSEVSTFHGHINCFGLATAIDWRDDGRGGGAAAIVEQAHRQNAIVSINHPNAFGDPWCSGCHWDYARADYAAFDAMEIWNGRWKEAETDNGGALAFWTELLDAGFRPTAVSGTDSHSAEEDEYVALPLNYVFATDRSEGAILDGIRRGRVFVSSGPTVSFRARGSDALDVVLPGATVPADGTFSLSVDVEEVAAPATLWYVTSGEVGPLAECTPPGAHVVRDHVVAKGWWRLEVRNGSAPNGDLLALTNPVYVATG